MLHSVGGMRIAQCFSVMKSILLPLHLDATTLGVLDYAEPMAAEMGASLTLLHVLSKQSYDNGTFSPGTPVHEKVFHEAQIILEQFSRRAISHGIRVKTLILDGNPAQVILEMAKKTQASLIIMHSLSGKDGFSNEEVLDSAPCPVLTCRK